MFCNNEIVSVGSSKSLNVILDFRTKLPVILNDLILEQKISILQLFIINRGFLRLILHLILSYRLVQNLLNRLLICNTLCALDYLFNVLLETSQRLPAFIQVTLVLLRFLLFIKVLFEDFLVVDIDLCLKHLKNSDQIIVELFDRLKIQFNVLE